MPYHLGVAKTILSQTAAQQQGNSPAREKVENSPNNDNNALDLLPIRCVSGSSSGAIAATVMTLLPHRLEEYTDRFLQDRGYAFTSLREIILEEAKTKGLNKSGPILSICTTRCSDGDIELFSFAGDTITPLSNEVSDTHISSSNDNSGLPDNRHERLLQAIEASCKIPRSFHPIDMVSFNKNWLTKLLPNINKGDVYPPAEGVIIDGHGYADGGIAAPFPPTLLDVDPACTGRIVVSPIAGEYFYQKQNDTTRDLPELVAIRPAIDASSWKAPLFRSVTLGGSRSIAGLDATVAVRAASNSQNLRVLTTAMGVVPSSGGSKDGGVLRDWYKRGQEDAHEALQSL